MAALGALEERKRQVFVALHPARGSRVKVQARAARTQLQVLAVRAGSLRSLCIDG